MKIVNNRPQQKNNRNIHIHVKLKYDHMTYQFHRVTVWHGSQSILLRATKKSEYI